MSFLHRLAARSFRPGALNSAASNGIFQRHPLTPTAKPLPTNFYTYTVHYRPAGLRFYLFNPKRKPSSSKGKLSNSKGKPSNPKENPSKFKVNPSNLEENPSNPKETPPDPPANPFKPHEETHSKLNVPIVYGALGINVAIFLLAKYYESQAREGHPENLTWFYRNFTINYDEVMEGRWWTIVTSTFTHIEPMHLLCNMISGYYFSMMVATAPGMQPLMLTSLILGSAVSGSLFWLLQRNRQIQREANGERRPRDRRRGLGFSGAVMGVGGAAAFMYPRTIIHIYGVLPIPLPLLIGGYILYDGYFLNDNRSRIAHSGHLGGVAFGILYYFAKIRFLRFS